MSSVSISNGPIVGPNDDDGHGLAPVVIGRRVSRGSGSPLVRAVLGSLSSVRRQTPGLQITAGAGGGIVAGYIFGKTSKMVAVFVGTTIIFLQLAECKGYLQIQDGKLKEDLETAREKLGEMIDGISAIGGGAVVGMVGGTRKNSGKELFKVVADNARLLCGFLGGILVGFGIS